MNYLIQGNQLFRKGKLKEALLTYQKAIEWAPNSELPNLKSAEVLEILGNKEDAIAHYYRAIELNPNSAWLHYKLGKLLVKSSKLDRGIKILKTGLKFNPKSYKYYKELGNALAQREEWEEAIENYQKAAELNRSLSIQEHNVIDFKSQLFQDKWVIMMIQGKQRGVFLEIGSTDGVELNNTFCLEKNFSWSGICVEPNPDFFQKLCENRTAITFPYAFYKQSGQIVEFIPNGVFGTISKFSYSDHHASKREKFVAEQSTIKVITACPEDILSLYNFPKYFDFLSLDVEGAELDILESIILSEWYPALACVEHNYVADRRLEIFELFSSYGYQRMECKWDDWYYNLEVLQSMNPEIPVCHYQRVLEYFCQHHNYKLNNKKK